MLPCREEADRRREVALSAVFESPVQSRGYGETLAESWALEKGHFSNNTPTSDSDCENGDDRHQHRRQCDTHFVSTGSGIGTGGNMAYKHNKSTLQMYSRELLVTWYLGFNKIRITINHTIYRKIVHVPV